MKAEVRAGLDRAASLVPGSGYAELTAGVVKPWESGLNAFVRAEIGWHPAENVSLFAFGEADVHGAQAGVGSRITF